MIIYHQEKKTSEITNKPIEPTLEKALKAVRDGHMTAYKACKLYSVNTETIRGITKSERKGRPPRFTVQQKQVLLDSIFIFAGAAPKIMIISLITL